MLYYLAIFLPLLSACSIGILMGVCGKGNRFAQWFSTSALVGSALCSAFVFWEVAVKGHACTLPLFNWLRLPYLTVSWSLGFDTLSAVMVLVVTTVSSMVHLYSIGYMHHDTSIPRFMGYLSLFTFFMLMLVTSKNLLQLFFGWEGVGLASYLLIGFWFEKDAANAAAMKAFLVNRVGDISFILGLLLIYLLTGSLDFDTIFTKLDLIQNTTWSFMGAPFSAVTVISLLLFGGAMGKSAQLGLHVWLPDAMEGPTPVSALIHAATMVTAGVFLLARMSPLLELSPFALMVIAIVGAATAFFAGTVAITQNDLKKVIAYSTCSQLGYMFFAIGMSAYHVAIFHLFTHAFFKALLFLGAGSVIHALSDEQDMGKMGGIWRRIPYTYTMMWIGTLALTGFPFLSGYYSKDLILESAYLSPTSVGQWVFWVGIVSAFLTALYSWRLMFLVFHGAPRSDERVMARIHEAPAVMLIPLTVLAVGSLCAGKLTEGLFTSQQFWQNLVPLSHTNHLELPLWVLMLPVGVGILGFAVAWFFYIYSRTLADILAQKCSVLYSFLYHKWYIDELYQALIVAPLWRLGQILWHKGDQGIIDPLLPDGAAHAIGFSAGRLSRFQSGYVFQYAVVMLVGVIGMTIWQIAQALMAQHCGASHG